MTGDDDARRPAWGPSPSPAPAIPERKRRLPVLVGVGLGLLTGAVAIGLLVYFFSKDADKDAQRVFVRVGACYQNRGGKGVLVTEACPARFRSYVGAPYPAANLVFHILVPTPAEWDANFRDGVCGVGDVSGAALSATVKGRLPPGADPPGFTQCGFDAPHEWLDR